MMIMMMMNCFCGIVSQQKVFSLVSCRDLVRDPHHHVDDDPATCVCVQRHKMPTSQHTSQFFVIKHACSIFADLSIVIGFPVSIQSIAVYLLNVYIAIPLSCGRFRAFYGASAPSPMWPDHRMADRCQVSIIWSI